MMKPTHLLIILLSISVNLFAQDDQKATAVLKEISAKTKTYKTIKADFIYKTEHKDKKINESQEGSVIIKGDKYKLNITGQEVISDNKSIWTYLKESNEVQINNVETDKNTDVINPSSIFTMYEKGFKNKFVGEEVIGGKTFLIINLYPLDPDKRKFHTVKLTIDKTLKQITELKIFSKDGTIYTYLIKKFEVNEEVPETLFTFDAKKYPKVEIVDLR